MDSYSSRSSSGGASWLAFLLLGIAVSMVMAALALALLTQREGLGDSRRQMVETSARCETELKRLASDIAMREAQLKRLAASREIRETQLQRMVDLRTKGETALKELAAARLQREAVVKQSSELQMKFQDLVLDLLLISKTDAEARAIVTKYNIQQNAPPGGGAPK